MTAPSDPPGHLRNRPPALWPSLLPMSDHGRDDLCVISAAGVRLRFADGHERLCATSGLWNVPLGYGNPVIADAIARTAHDLSYGSAFRYENAQARAAAEALVARCGIDRYHRIIFSTSGGAANDLVIKLARHYQVLRGHDRRKIVVALTGSYHGLTFGGFALTGEPLGHQLYGVDQRLIRHVDPCDATAFTALMERIGAQVAAVVVEPVLGSGTVPLPVDLIDAIGRARQTHGFVLVADEVATGFTRTGPMFASDEWAIPPDVLIMSKALTNGTCAAAAVAVGPEISAAFTRHAALLVHAETQAGTAITAAAILATLTELDRIDAVATVADLTPRLEHGHGGPHFKEFFFQAECNFIFARSV